MAFCVVQGVYLGQAGDDFGGHLPVQATLESDVTKALGKGCSLAGAFTPLLVGTGKEYRGTTGVQPMLCPKAMVGTAPATLEYEAGNTGECVV